MAETASKGDIAEVNRQNPTSNGWNNNNNNIFGHAAGMYNWTSTKSTLLSPLPIDKNGLQVSNADLIKVESGNQWNSSTGYPNSNYTPLPSMQSISQSLAKSETNRTNIKKEPDTCTYPVTQTGYSNLNGYHTQNPNPSSYTIDLNAVGHFMPMKSNDLKSLPINTSAVRERHSVIQENKRAFKQMPENGSYNNAVSTIAQNSGSTQYATGYSAPSGQNSSYYGNGLWNGNGWYSQPPPYTAAVDAEFGFVNKKIKLENTAEDIYNKLLPPFCPPDGPPAVVQQPFDYNQQDKKCLGESVSASLLSLQEFDYSSWTTQNNTVTSSDLTTLKAVPFSSLEGTLSQNINTQPMVSNYSALPVVEYTNPVLCSLQACDTSTGDNGVEIARKGYKDDRKVENTNAGQPVLSVSTDLNASLDTQDQSCSSWKESPEREPNKNAICRCGICGDAFEESDELRAHVRVHAENLAFKCEMCGKSNADKNALKEHYKEHMNEEIFNCDVCDQVFEDKKGLKNHQNIHKDMTNFSCDECSTVCASNEELLQHSLQHGVQNPHECSLCNEIFGQETLLFNHMRMHSEVFTFMCHICDKKYRTNKDLQVHISKHTGFTPFECSVCMKGFISDYSLQKHVSVHTGIRSYVCTICGKGYKRAAELREHASSHAQEKQYICEICCKGFKSRTNLIEHHRIHSGEKPFACDVCGKKFRQSSILRNHVRIHTGETPWCCHHCGKKFSFKGNYVRHLWSHTEEKDRTCEHCGKLFTDLIGLRQHLERHVKQQGPSPKSKSKFKCTICESQFEYSSALETHMLSHDVEKPFRCEFCLKDFSSKQELEIHSHVHMNDKTYKCNLCDKSYIDNGRLRRHMKTHTGIKPYKCEICSSAFTENYHLKKHLLTHQKDSQPTFEEDKMGVDTDSDTSRLSATPSQFDNPPSQQPVDDDLLKSGDSDKSVEAE